MKSFTENPLLNFIQSLLVPSMLAHRKSFNRKVFYKEILKILRAVD